MRRPLVSLLLAIGSYFLVTAAGAAPVANLPLTCSSATAVGQPQGNCTGVWTYQLPNTDQLIVLEGPSAAPTWNRAASLANTDTLAVCTLAVEPGSYSGCKDAAGVRRIAFVAQSQVFPSSPPSGGSGAKVLDLGVPVVINAPGLYVIDRDWTTALAPSAVAVRIEADEVTFDLRGFTISGGSLLVGIGADSVTVRNGNLQSSTWALAGGGSDILIDSMRITTTTERAVDIFGARTVIANCIVSAPYLAVFAERGVVVRNNAIRATGAGPAILAQDGAFVIDNQITCDGAQCVRVIRGHSTISKNVLTSRGVGIRVDGGNHVLDNSVLVVTHADIADSTGEPVYVHRAGEVAIQVDGSRNTIRGNYVEASARFVDVPGSPQRVPWLVGMRFGPSTSDNRYGDNLMGAEVPFDLGATVQTDLGGNQALIP